MPKFMLHLSWNQGSNFEKIMDTILGKVPIWVVFKENEMIQIEKIEIKLPKWKWWQVTLELGVICISPNLDPVELLKMAKEILKIWLVG